MQHVFARKALLPEGWADNVRLGVDNGCLTAVQAGVRPGADDCVVGCIIPGLANAHSHAFQRALAGHTEQRSPAGRDNFWTWRERMYELAGKVYADILYAIARQAYTEMLESGYTAVAEFHYLHRQPGSSAADDAMADALLGAAADSGIRLTYVPVLYERSGFDSHAPQGRQQQFALTLDEFLAHHERIAGRSGRGLNVGIGVHSLRAVHEDSLQRIAEFAAAQGIPMHLHIAEQQREVEQCMGVHNRRPVRWLLDTFEVSDNWCLVHATHLDAEEVEALASSGAVVCLCPSTEANLGDGLFPLSRFLEHGGRIAIGSDSHVSINPFEELRWLEYGQRLVTQSRNVVALQDVHVGRELFLRALAGGLQASSRGITGLAEGAAADFVVLDDGDPMLLGHSDDSRLDALVFSGYRLPVERVMVNGAWCVEGGVHTTAEATRSRYADTVQQLVSGS